VEKGPCERPGPPTSQGPSRVGESSRDNYSSPVSVVRAPLQKRYAPVRPNLLIQFAFTLFATLLFDGLFDHDEKFFIEGVPLIFALTHRL
jgi:hypothetical protein